ncbi:MAG: ribonuclease III domain-containing protein [Syntrophomonadaceae bacterium]|jgi:ribonuclease-3 family protein|nr:Mini-ribonuclease 3 [Syntrophomonadaceae bacterium]MDH7497327.1 ribonuclease III domain-containing protein [Syntrophomonadaceae bacterium]
MLPARIEGRDLREYSPALLAYVGDAVYELYVRSHLVAGGNLRVKDAHQQAVSVVRAESQARLLRAMATELSEEEAAVMRRGRNAKGRHAPRGVDTSDYRLSTGLEALIGYLYLKGDYQRLQVLMERALSER